jgi:hypothetical protein
MRRQENWRIRFVGGTEEVVFGACPQVSNDGNLLIVREYTGVTDMLKDTRWFVLSNVLAWEKA